MKAGQAGGVKLRSYFYEKLSVEQEHMDKVLPWLTQTYGFTLVEDLRENPVYWEQDIDLLLMDETMGVLTAEVKIRITLYSDIAFETKSSTEDNTLGNLYKSKADLLVYVFMVNGEVHENSCVLHLPTVRNWFGWNKHKYKPKYAPNPPDSPTYHTEFYPVPLVDLPVIAFYPKKEVI